MGNCIGSLPIGFQFRTFSATAKLMYTDLMLLPPCFGSDFGNQHALRFCVNRQLLIAMPSGGLAPRRPAYLSSINLPAGVLLSSSLLLTACRCLVAYVIAHQTLSLPSKINCPWIFQSCLRHQRAGGRVLVFKCVHVCLCDD